MHTYIPTVFLFCNGCERLITNKKLINELRETKFDMAIIQTYELVCLELHN